MRLLEPEGTRNGSTHMILTLGRERREDHEFKAGLHWATLRDPVERRTKPQGIKGWCLSSCQEDLVGSNGQSVTIVYASPCLSNVNLEKQHFSPCKASDSPYLTENTFCQSSKKAYYIFFKATCSTSHQIHHYPPNHTLNQKPG